jgi:hypothetical protein
MRSASAGLLRQRCMVTDLTWDGGPRDLASPSTADPMSGEFVVDLAAGVASSRLRDMRRLWIASVARGRWHLPRQEARRGGRTSASTQPFAAGCSAHRVPPQVRYRITSHSGNPPPAARTTRGRAEAALELAASSASATRRERSQHGDGSRGKRRNAGDRVPWAERDARGCIPEPTPGPRAGARGPTSMSAFTPRCRPATAGNRPRSGRGVDAVARR